MKLTSKERFRLAAAHKDVDRPVIDFEAAGEIKAGLMDFFRVKDSDELLERLQVDVRNISADYIGPPLQTFPDGSKLNIFGVREKTMRAEFGTTTIQVAHPLAGMNSINDFRKGYRFPAYEYFDFKGVKKKAHRYENYALNAGWMALWYLYIFLRGMEQAMMDMTLNREFFDHVMNACADYYKGYMKRMLEAADGDIDYVMTYEDFGATRGLLISLDDIRDKILVHYRELAKLFSDYGARFAFHSCGSVYQAIPALIKTGVSILDPIQVSAEGMDIVFLKNTYGDRLTFRGGIDTTELLPKGTKEEIKETVRHTIDVLGKNGGYIFCSSNSINADTPIENVLTMYETALGGKL